jgi:hypothetical protein
MKITNHLIQSLLICISIFLTGLFAQAMPLAQIERIKANSLANLKAATELQEALTKLDGLHGCQDTPVSAKFIPAFERAGIQYSPYRSTNENEPPQIAVAPYCSSQPVKPMIAALMKSYFIEAAALKTLYKNLLSVSEDPKARQVLAELKASETAKVNRLKAALKAEQAKQKQEDKTSPGLLFWLGLAAMIGGAFFFGFGFLAMFFLAGEAGIGTMMLTGVMIAALGASTIGKSAHVEAQQADTKARIQVLDAEIESRYRMIAEMDQFEGELSKLDIKFSNPLP